jgi:mannose-1-phosphate guanylyltransferase
VGVDGDGRIVRLRRETVSPREVLGGWFAAVHVVGAPMREGLPAKGCLVGDVYLPALRRGEELRAFAVDRFSDIGDLASYVDANEAWLGSRWQTAWTGDGARIAPGVRLSRTVVGKGAIVEGSGTLARCVVWPGARAVAPLTDAVVLGDQTVTLPPPPSRDAGNVELK